VKQTASFYHFFKTKPKGEYCIYLNDSAMSNVMGREDVKRAFEEAAGIKFGEMTADGKIGLYDTACMGMSDQEPAALINHDVFTNLTPHRASQIIEDIKSGKELKDMYYEPFGDGNNSSSLIKSMVNNNIRKSSLILDDLYEVGTALEIAINKSDLEIIGIVKTSGIRGRGGAGFPTGMKWEFCKMTPGNEKYVFCNADEGEPGTFKDRVLLTEHPQMVFEGMALAGYAIGSSVGIIYLRYEYKYLQAFLEEQLEIARKENRLGDNIGGKSGFNFDIRIQFGAGAYVCGEESALIESAEGKRGEPRFKPPFPVQKGYNNKPTSVNNVETFCSVCRIVEKGGEWYKKLGTQTSRGTKLLSISGDVQRPGVYEVEWGMTVQQMLDMVGAKNTQAVQVAGPSGSLIGPDEFDRQICYGDLSTGGAMMVFDEKRNLLDIVINFMDFFIDESCGSCTTCRITSQQLRKRLIKIKNGRGVAGDLDDLKNWAEIMKSSRCGLGMSACNPVLSSLKNFRSLYEEKLQKDVEFDECFDLDKAIVESSKAAGREATVNH
jgi:[NiFe] hydrogenase diaphorase moiety large subunit